ncbi:lipid kinase, partial [Rhizobium leguminosarum]
MQTFSKILSLTALTASLALGLGSLATADQKTDFKVAWSLYVGWMPWGYAADH